MFDGSKKGFSLTQQSLAAESRTPNWIADLVVGGTAALLAVTVAQAALPDDDVRIAKLNLRPAPAAQPIAAAPPPAEPEGIVFGEPVPGYPVISPFGLRKLPWEQYGRLHQGVDIAAPAGSPVQAISDGVVVQTGQDGAYGRFVEVRHADGLSSFYAHLGGFSASARAGAAVKRGDSVGRVGSTGSSTGAHLHIEVRRDGRPLNPTYFIGRRYASAEELPLRQAGYVPRRVRIAYVSYIPKSKRELMEAREEAKAQAEEEARAARALARERAQLASLTKLQVSQLAPIDRIQDAPAGPEPASAVVTAPPELAAPKPAAAKPAAPKSLGEPAAPAASDALSVGIDANGRVRGTLQPGA